MIISGPNVFTTYSICSAQQPAADGSMFIHFCWMQSSDIIILIYSSSSLARPKDLHSNSTRTTAGHKTEQHEETSRDYNTHAEYEWSTNIDLDDIFISVKTTKKYHDSRLRLIVETWFQLARDQVISHSFKRPLIAVDRFALMFFFCSTKFSFPFSTLYSQVWFFTDIDDEVYQNLTSTCNLIFV